MAENSVVPFKMCYTRIYQVSTRPYHVYQGKALMESAAFLTMMSRDTENGVCWGFLPGRNAEGKGKLLVQRGVCTPPKCLAVGPASKDPLVDVSEKCVIHIGKVFF